MTGLRVLSRADVLAAGGAEWQPALDDIHDALAQMRAGTACMVAENALPLGPDPRARAYGLPALVGGRHPAAGIKWAVHMPGPAGISSATLVNRPADGVPVGLVESALITRIRTAAVTALALQGLAPGARRVALLGAGAQARTHLAMLRALFPGLEAVHAWNRTPAQAHTMCAEAAWPAVTVHGTLEAALDGVDAVIACTATTTPLLGPEAVRPGRLIAQIGYHEAAFELIDATDSVVVDLWGAFAATSAKSLFQMHRAGRFAPARVAADLAGLVLDGWRPAPGASVFFSSFGLNVFDIAIAARLLHRAEAAGIGTVLPFSP